MSDDILDLKAGDQFFAVRAALVDGRKGVVRTPYQVTSMLRRPGAGNGVWIICTARRLHEVTQPILGMRHINHVPHDEEIILRKRVEES